MAAIRNRLNGSKLTLTIDNKEFSPDISSWEVTDEERDGGTVTFADAAAGTTGQINLKVTVVQSLDADSLHQIVMDNPARKNVAFTLAPAGNTTPTVAQPFFTGLLDFPKLRPSMGIDAGSEDNTTEIVFTCTKWTKQTTNTTPSSSE